MSGESGAARTDVVAVRVWVEQPVEWQREPRELRVIRAPGPRQRPGQRFLLVEQILRAVAHAPRLDQQHARAVGQQIRQQVLVGGEPRQPRLHPVEGLTLGETLPLLAAPRCLGHQVLGTRPHLVGGQQLPAREHGNRIDVVSAPLVRDRELGETLDLVTPQVDAHRVVRGRREHVHDRAADGDLAAAFHLILTAVSHRHELLDEIVPVDRIADPQSDRLDGFDVRTESLHQRRAREQRRRPARRRRRSGGAT